MAEVPVDWTTRAETIHTASSDTHWWRSAVVYQVYPRSFGDADGDGIGDLRGITERIEHIARLGVDAIWLSPFYPSPLRDGGYDVSNYRDVDPILGSLADLDELLAQAHRRSIRVIIDIVPNHTSSDHPWFQAALASLPDSADRARYIFRDGSGEHGELPPNNWSSIFGGSAWTRVVEPDTGLPGQWYLHLFDSSQPDLNWDEAEVRREFESILRFWLDRGVDGFRVDVAHGLVKKAGLPDWGGAQHLLEAVSAPMWDQDEVHEVYRRWRTIVDEYPGDRALVAEAWLDDQSRAARYVRPDEMHQTFNMELLLGPWDSASIRRIVTDSLAVNDEVDATTTWVLNNHDGLRHTTRAGLPVPGARPNGIGPDDVQPDEELGLRRARALTLLMLALPGSAYLYQGEELGLPDHTMLPPEVRQDPVWFRTRDTDDPQLGRDGCRVPLPWTAMAPAFGFSPSGASWLPQPASWADYAADVQEGVDGSTLELYRTALRLRRDLRLGSGSLTWLTGESVPPDVVAFQNRDVLVVCNQGAEPVTMLRPGPVVVRSWDVASDAEDSTVVIPAATTVWMRHERAPKPMRNPLNRF